MSVADRMPVVLAWPYSYRVERLATSRSSVAGCRAEPIQGWTILRVSVAKYTETMVMIASAIM